MLLYYCLGGGLGHITRYLAFCHTFAVQPDLITVCNSVKERKIDLENVKIHIPQENDIQSRDLFRRWLTSVIVATRPRQFIIDAFPAGILGELCDLKILEEIECVYLARHLKWNEYQKRLQGKPPKFSRVLLLEELCPDHQAFISNLTGANVSEISLVDDEAPQISDLPADYWLIVHSEAGEELEALWNFARETASIQDKKPAFVVVSPGKKPAFIPKEVLHLDVFSAHGMFAGAAKVFSGAGFNIVRQMRPYAHKHYILPFERSLDDQFFRASKVANAHCKKTAPFENRQGVGVD
jgi:hypothetical protein